MDFKVLEEHGETGIVIMPKHFCIGTRGRFKEIVQELILRGFKKLVLDFSHTSFIDTTGRDTIIQIDRWMKRAEGTVRLLHAEEFVCLFGPLYRESFWCSEGVLDPRA